MIGELSTIDDIIAQLTSAKEKKERLIAKHTHSMHLVFSQTNWDSEETFYRINAIATWILVMFDIKQREEIIHSRYDKYFQLKYISSESESLREMGIHFDRAKIDCIAGYYETYPEQKQKDWICAAIEEKCTCSLNDFEAYLAAIDDINQLPFKLISANLNQIGGPDFDFHIIVTPIS